MEMCIEEAILPPLLPLSHKALLCIYFQIPNEQSNKVYDDKFEFSKAKYFHLK